METEAPPPPPPSSNDANVATDPPPDPGSDWDDETRVQPDEILRALGVREDTREVMRQMLEEALAPLHFAVRDLERRLSALERMPPPQVAPPGAVAPHARPVGHVPPDAIPSVEIAPSVSGPAYVPPHAGPPGATSVPRMNLDVFGAVVTSPRVLAVPPPRAASFDGEIPFDGARRRRRIGLLFGIFLVLIFGALFGALISSRVGAN